MNAKQTTAPPAPGLGLGDIYYILFRRKWVIVGASLLGFIAAGLVLEFWQVPYQSNALIYIDAIFNARSPTESGADTRVTPLDQDRQGSILNSECMMMSSLDVAKAAAEAVGPSNILADYGGGKDVNAAAMVIQRNFVATPPKNTQIISLTFSSPSRDLVKPVLDQLITNYIVRHTEMHLKPGFWDEFLVKETDMLGQQLKQTDEQLAKTRNDAHVINIAEAMKLVETQDAAIKQEIHLNAAELAAAEAMAAQLKTMIPATTISSNGASTNRLEPPTVAETEAYRKARAQVAQLEAEAAKLESYTTNNPRVQTNMIEMEAAQAKQKKMETDIPGLLAMGAAESKTTSAPTRLEPAAAYREVEGRIAELKTRLALATNDLLVIEAKGTSLNDLEPKLTSLERKRELDAEHFKQISLKLAVARFDSDMGDKRFSNISIVQNPSPAGRDLRKLTQMVAGVAGGGVALGLGLAFLLEMLLDRSFKRPQEVVAKLGLPFFLSVPYLNGHGKLRLSKRGQAVKLLAASGDAPKVGGAESRELAPAQEGPIAPWDEKHALRPFHETLRDRLIAYFEMINLTHKPKLVALTSCHHGAGVSTMASGLASVLSETGDGNVLLVNMNSEDGDAHHFYKGKLNLGLDDIFEKEKTDRETALVQENLYVVKESSNRDKLPAILPKRFSHLVSKMKASDYDYIIFDMPPVTQISVTPRLARFMDMVLLVVESEKTDREVAQRASSLLAESRANMGVVMNKSRSYVPRQLHQEL